MRKGRWSQPGQVYLVTFTTHTRRVFFNDWFVNCDAARLITSSTNWRQANLLAWVLMPDHWHGLIELGHKMPLSECIRLLKGTTARQLREQHPALGQIWARGFHDRGLRCDDDLAAAARYVVMNPVRAGLVRRVSDYPFWDAVWVDPSRGRG